MDSFIAMISWMPTVKFNVLVFKKVLDFVLLFAHHTRIGSVVLKNEKKGFTNFRQWRFRKVFLERKNKTAVLLSVNALST